jgi:hypothetical protein
MDTWSGVWNLKAGLDRNIDETSAVVRDDLLEAQTWMNQGTEFGEAWLAYTGGALWADYIVNLFDQAIKKDLYPFFSGVDDGGLNMLEIQEDMPRGHKKYVETKIVNRLKELNVVFAETDPGKLDQANRVIEGSPRPEADIKGAVNTGHDIEAIYSWAKGFLKSAPGDAAHKFFPPADPQTLSPLPSYP